MTRQSQWIKAVEIVATETMNVVCWLEGFHLLMSLLGSTGSVMAGTVLSEALKSIYVCNE